MPFGIPLRVFRRPCKFRWASCNVHFRVEGVPLPCKPDSVPLLRGWTAISLTPPKRSALLAQSATNTRGSNGRAALPLFCLAPRGVCHAVRLPGFAVGSYSTISPLPVSLRTIGGIFLLHFPSEFLAVPVPHFHEARCPVVSGLSSPPLARNCDRPGSGGHKLRELPSISNQKDIEKKPDHHRQPDYKVHSHSRHGSHDRADT